LLRHPFHKPRETGPGTMWDRRQNKKGRNSERRATDVRERKGIWPPVLTNVPPQKGADHAKKD